MPVNTIELEHAIIKHVLVNVIPTLDKGTMFGSEQNEFFEACNTIFLNTTKTFNIRELIGDVEATKLGNCNHPIIFLMRFRDKYKVQSFDIKYGSKLLTTKTLYVKKGELKTNPVILINFIIKAVEDAMKHLPEAVALLDPAKVSSVQAAHEDVQQTEQEGAGDENYALNSANEITESVLASKHLSHLHVKHHGNDDNKQSVDELTTKAVDTFVAVSEAGKIDPQVSE